MTAGSHRWLVLVAMTGSASMIMLDQTVVAVALPSMTRELPLHASGQQWVVNAYVLATAAAVALGGRAADVLGRVRTFRAGVILFFLASAGCGLVPPGPAAEGALIAFRALQGLGAALMMPVSGAIVVDAFAPGERGRAMAAYAGISQVFLALGPLLGGVLTELVSWRAVFWLNVPVGLAALVLVHVARPDEGRPAGGGVSPGAAVLLVSGLGATVLGVQQAGAWGAPAVLTLAAGLVLLAGFAVGALRARDPLLDLRLLARRAFLGNLVVAGLVQFGLLAVVLFGSLYLQDLLRLRPMTTGLAALPLIVPVAVASQIGGRWYDRSGVRPPVLTGLVVAVTGLVAWTVALPDLAYRPQVPGMILTSVGLGLLLSPTNADALDRVPAGARAQASGLMQTGRQLGGTLGVAVIGTIVLAVEPHGTLAPSPQAAADAIATGFAAAAAACALALVAAVRLLPRDSDAVAR